MYDKAHEFLTAEEKKRILKNRALKIASEETVRVDTDEVEVLEFVLSGERYAIESGYIREVQALRSYTAVPCTPPYVLGIINVRGRIISVIDMGKFFGLSRIGLTDLNKVIILSAPGMEFGILADETTGVRMVPVSDIGTSMVTLTDARAGYLKGVMAERLIVLDGGKILSDPGLVVNETVQ